MLNFKHFFKGIVVVNSVLLVLFFIHYQSHNKTVAVVRTGEVLENYLGVKDLQNALTKKRNEYSGRLDTLTVLYNEARINLEENANKLSEKDKQAAQNNLIKRQKDYSRYKQHTEEKLAEYSEKLTQGTLNQVNHVVKIYAEENNIDVVIGVTQFGNVMHGNPSVDITDEIINELNTNY